MDIVGSVGGRTLKLKHIVASNVEITEFLNCEILHKSACKSQ